MKLNEDITKPLGNVKNILTGEFFILIAHNYKPERVQINDLMQLKILEKQEKNTNSFDSKI